MRDINNYVKEYKNHDFEQIQVGFRRKKILERLNLYPHKHILEIGCGFDPVFQYMDNFDSMTVVDPGIEFIEHAKNISKTSKHESSIRCIHGFFEDLIPELSQQTYDFILVSSLLHELESPDSFLETLRSVCSINTILHINVPNAFSIHRILAKEMGLITEVFQKSETQKKLQQFSTFSIDSLEDLLKNKHFEIIESGSYFIKPFTHSQMNDMLVSNIIDTKVLDGLYKLTKYIPEYGSEIFVDCRIRNFSLL
jgi:2-polyprenyl-3-methyl-5-hydroxy-6-metoxy-1,4-benzoquinol methylase